MKEDVKQFKIGMLMKLAELGITPSEFLNKLSKQAMDPLDVIGRIAGGAGSAGQGVLSTGLSAGLNGLKTLGTAALVAPAVLGAGAGIATERLESPDPAALKSIQSAELIGLYRRLTKEINNRKATHNSERVV